MVPRLVKCMYCEHEWETSTPFIYVVCPSCNKRTRINPPKTRRVGIGRHFTCVCGADFLTPKYYTQHVEVCPEAQKTMPVALVGTAGIGMTSQAIKEKMEMLHLQEDKQMKQITLSIGQPVIESTGDVKLFLIYRGGTKFIVLQETRPTWSPVVLYELNVGTATQFWFFETKYRIVRRTETNITIEEVT